MMAGQRNSYGKRYHSQSNYADNGRNKRRNTDSDKDPFSVGPDDTVYRYLCPGKKIGNIIGKGGEIVKQLRVDTKSKIRIGETVPDCEERIVTIYSSSEETNDFDGSEDRVCPAQDALLMVHEKIVSDTVDKNSEDAPQVTVRLLVPSDQIGCILGKRGQIVQNIHSETGAQIRILKDNHLPACALSSDELVQVMEDHILFDFTALLFSLLSTSLHYFIGMFQIIVLLIKFDLVLIVHLRSCNFFLFNW